ncbi:MAG: hypothetical protein ABIT83_01325 [Massilia sp.]
MIETFQLAAPLAQHDVLTVLNALRAQQGVDAVEAVAGQNRVEVRFDQQRTSQQELGAVLARAGFKQGATPRRHLPGGCCGGCGG